MRKYVEKMEITGNSLEKSYWPRLVAATVAWLAALPSLRVGAPRSCLDGRARLPPSC